jgi:hypothetical protein
VETQTSEPSPFFVAPLEGFCGTVYSTSHWVIWAIWESESIAWKSSVRQPL